jgi:hypothetical protein
VARTCPTNQESPRAQGLPPRKAYFEKSRLTRDSAIVITTKKGALLSRALNSAFLLLMLADKNVNP